MRNGASHAYTGAINNKGKLALGGLAALACFTWYSCGDNISEFAQKINPRNWYANTAADSTAAKDSTKAVIAPRPEWNEGSEVGFMANDTLGLVHLGMKDGKHNYGIEIRTPKGPQYLTITYGDDGDSNYVLERRVVK